MLTESELIKKMDAMKPEIKQCPDCALTFNMDDWRALTSDQKWYVRDLVPFVSKRSYRADGSLRVGLERRCRKCAYEFDNRSKSSRGLDSAGRPRNPVKLKYGPGTPEFIFFRRVKPCEQ